MIATPLDDVSRYISFDDNFARDWQDIFKDPTISKRYYNKFEQLYLNLISYGHEKCHSMFPKKYDVVADSKVGLLKIDFQNKPINLRVFYCFDKIQRKYIFLHCFNKGKGADYNLAIKKAEGRLKAIL